MTHLLVLDNDILLFLCRDLPWYLLVLWSLYSFSVILFTKLLSKITNYYLIESIPSMFITLGLLGTFLGITYGLINFNTDPEFIKDSIKELLEGLKTAFYTSIFGIVGSLIFKTVINYKLNSGIIAHPDDLKEQDLYTSMNNNLIAIREQTKSSLLTLNDIKDNKLKNISDGTDGLAKKLDQFFDDMAKQSAGAIQEALMSVIEDFNDTFKTFIGQLVEQNFDKLTQSIDQLITWQKDYKGDITNIKDAYERLANNHKDFVNNTENWVSKLDAIAGSSSQLQNIINDFQSAFDDESRFSDVINKINEAVGNLHNTSEVVNKHTDQLSKTTDALTLTKDEISTWLNQEEGVRSMVTALGDSLKQLREFDITQVESLDKAFINRLENTFKGLDEVMAAQYLNNISEIRIEGHTDTIPPRKSRRRESYDYNLELSSNRARSVLNYIRNHESYLSYPDSIKTRLDFLFTANGLSYSRVLNNSKDMVYLSNDKSVNNDLSRRVEFKIVTSNEELAESIIKKKK